MKDPVMNAAPIKPGIVGSVGAGAGEGRAFGQHEQSGRFTLLPPEFTLLRTEKVQAEEHEGVGGEGCCVGDELLRDGERWVGDNAEAVSGVGKIVVAGVEVVAGSRKSSLLYLPNKATVTTRGTCSVRLWK